MNDTPEQPLDPRLIEAIGDATMRRELIDDVCALTDGPMTEALDRALGPASVVCDEAAMIERICAATGDRRAVLARIGWGGRRAWPLAAMLALAAGGYGWWRAMTDPTPTPTPRIVASAASVPALTLDELEQEFAAFAEDSSFDQQIALVSAGVEQMQGQTIWTDSPDDLVDRAAQAADWYPSF